MNMRALFAICLLATAMPATAQTAPGSPLINYDGYTEMVSEVAPVRRERLITLADFNARATRADVLVLDARSAQAFAEGHIKGAVNLPLPDFTAKALTEVIGANSDREILIYCNNNFTNNRSPVETKRTELALNIQTFINLYGYGYRNVFELGEAVDMDAPEVGWVKDATT
jgi:phage shock protein E